VHVEEIGPVEAEGAPVSSSRVRKLVAAGQVEAAARLLGRPHRLHGTVVRGDQRGRVIGFPTANLDNEVELLPADGVYAVRASIDGGALEDGVMNIGVRPTFAGESRGVEVHLLGGAGELYGREMAVEVIARVRAERRFDGVEELVRQIGLDVAAAREVLR
jgi:riboflavin kinase/FMN adenylyltransferase